MSEALTLWTGRPSTILNPIFLMWTAKKKRWGDLVLSQDPRPSYQEDAHRIYGMEYAGMEVRFQVEENVLRVCEIEYLDVD